MSNIPDAHARLIAPARTGDPYMWKLVACPHCGDQHTHGAGVDGKDPGGHRSAHCAAGKGAGGYNIIPAI